MKTNVRSWRFFAVFQNLIILDLSSFEIHVKEFLKKHLYMLMYMRRIHEKAFIYGFFFLKWVLFMNFFINRSIVLFIEYNIYQCYNITLLGKIIFTYNIVMRCS